MVCRCRGDRDVEFVTLMFMVVVIALFIVLPSSPDAPFPPCLPSHKPSPVATDISSHTSSLLPRVAELILRRSADVQERETRSPAFDPLLRMPSQASLLLTQKGNRRDNISLFQQRLTASKTTRHSASLSPPKSKSQASEYSRFFLPPQVSSRAVSC